MEFDFRRFQDRRRSSQETPWDRFLLILPVVILLVMMLCLVVSSVYRVEPYEKAVVLRFGKYQRTVGPGLHFCIPLAEETWKVSVAEHSLSLPFGPRPDRPKAADDEKTLMLTGDLNGALVEWTIQWGVDPPEDYLFRFYDPGDPTCAERVISTAAETVMSQLVGDYSIDEVLTEKRGEIEKKALVQTQEILKEYQCGVAIRDLQLQRTTPPGKVRSAYMQVHAAEQQREQLKNEADTQRNKLLPEAEAEKDKLITEAQGYAKRRQAEAEGDIAALLAKYRAYQKAPDAARKQLYLEAMEEILGNIESKVVVDADLKGILPLLPLEQGAGHE